MLQSKRKKRFLKRSSSDELPMSAMIDVVFLLLIYFIVSFKVNPVEAHLAVNLPSSNPGPPVIDMPLTLIVEPGLYKLEGHTFTLGEIEAQLTEMKTMQTDFTTRIMVSPSAREGELLALLDICYKLQLNDLNVQTLIK